MRSLSLRAFQTLQVPFICPCHFTLRVVRWTSTDSDAAPPMLAKIRNDLKFAMRTKDTPRLNVLRSLITEISNASKGPTPIKTDMQILNMLRKRMAASRTAAQEFIEAKREDLKIKQEAEICVLGEYAGQIITMSEEEITQAVDEALEAVNGATVKGNVALVMKELFKPGGRLRDKPVETAQVAQIVKRRLAQP